MSHVFDLATHWGSDNVNILITQGWHALPTDDGGADEDYGQWDLDSASWHTGDPVTYPAIPYANQDASLCSGGHRYIASKQRPLTGIYSDSGREDNAASIAHIDRQLGVIRRAGDPRARIDVIACTLGIVQFTSHNGYEEGDADYTRGPDTRYRHLDKMLERANAAGLTNCVTANYEAYYVWLYFSDIYDTKIKRLNAVARDMQDLVNKLQNDPAAWKVDERVVICWYEGGLNIPGSGIEDITPAEWAAVMDTVRKPYSEGEFNPAASGSDYGTGHDFFVIGRNYGAGDVSWLDGLYPWIRVDLFDEASGTDLQKASTWAQEAVTDYIQAAVAANSGRVALANYTPGFDDYALNFGSGLTGRVIPRTTDIASGQFAGITALDPAPSGIVLVTWDDYAEGTNLEPTVQDQGELLAQWTEGVAVYEGDTPSANDTEALLEIWRGATPYITCPVQYRQGGRSENVATGEALTSGHGTT